MNLSNVIGYFTMLLCCQQTYNVHYRSYAEITSLMWRSSWKTWANFSNWHPASCNHLEWFWMVISWMHWTCFVVQTIVLLSGTDSHFDTKSFLNTTSLLCVCFFYFCHGRWAFVLRNTDLWTTECHTRMMHRLIYSCFIHELPLTWSHELQK